MEKAGKHLRIAIFSGEVPSTTFIEYLILWLSKDHQIQLYGVKKKPVNYGANVCLITNPQNKFHNLLLTFYRGIFLLVKSPKSLFKLVNEIKGYKDLYSGWVWFSKLLPIILYKPDVFHIQWAEDIEFYGCLQSKFDIPIVLSCRGAHISYKPIVNPLLREVYKKYFPNIKGYHAVSEDMKRQVIALGANPELVHVIYSPISNSKLERFTYNLRSKNDKDSIKIISVGRFHWKKGYDYALEAMRILKEKGLDFKYTLVAQGHPSEQILFLINEMGLEDVVEIVNGMEQELLLNTMKTNDILILSSVEEGIANVVLEAMAIGLPVVSTNCGGMAEVVRSNQTGWLVPVRNPGAIANAVEEIMNTPENELKRVVKNAHELVRTQFGTQSSIDQFLKLYNIVLEN